MLHMEQNFVIIKWIMFSDHFQVTKILPTLLAHLTLGTNPWYRSNYSLHCEFVVRIKWATLHGSNQQASGHVNEHTVKADGCFTFIIINTKGKFFFIFTKRKFWGCDRSLWDIHVKVSYMGRRTFLTTTQNSSTLRKND